MKHYIKIGIFFILIIMMLLLTGCTAEDPGYVIISNNNPLGVSIDGNPEVKIIDDSGNILTTDPTTRVLTTIEFEHHTIHAGDMFTFLEVTDLGNGAVRDILFVTPNTTKWAHLVWEIEHELETAIQFYMDTTYSDNGTKITSFNRNGNSNNIATTLVYHTPTITNVGTLVGTIQQGDGKKAGGSDRESNEYILKQNTAYLIRITNLTANNNLIFLKVNWYELINEDSG